MSDGALLYHEELQDQELQLEGLLAGDSSRVTAAQISKAQATLKRLNKILQQFRIEVRLMDDESAQRTFEGHAQAHTQKIATLKASLQRVQEEQRQRQATPAAATAAAQPQQPPVAAAASGADAPPRPPLAPTSTQKPAYSLWSPQEDYGGDEPIDDGKGEARSAAQRIEQTQQSTLQSLGNTEKMLNDTETMGHEAATTLRMQTEQIQQTNQSLDEMHSEVGRAGKELKSFMRRMARDRIIICFSITIVVCLIIIVVLAIIKHKT